jgi:cutinase
VTAGRRVAAAVVVALALAAAATWWATGRSTGDDPQAATHGFAETRCADVIVLGLRGSGQSPTRNAGVGAEVLRAVRAMAERLQERADVSVRLEDVPYEAATPSTLTAYEASVDDGVRRLTRQYDRLVADCPDSRLALVGFSQGAEVVHAFAADLSPARAEPLALAAMIADPRRDPDDDIASVSFGDGPAPRPGRLGPGPRFSDATRDAALALCVADDEVFSFPVGARAGEPSEVHRHFYEGAEAARAAGRAMDETLARRGVASSG